MGPFRERLASLNLAEKMRMAVTAVMMMMMMVLLLDLTVGKLAREVGHLKFNARLVCLKLLLVGT